MAGNINKFVEEATKLVGSDHITTNLAMRHSYVARSVMGIRAGVSEAIVSRGTPKKCKASSNSATNTKFLSAPTQADSAEDMPNHSQTKGLSLIWYG